MPRCTLCFADKPRLETVIPHTSPVCRGCFLQVDRVLGWIQHQGMEVQLGLWDERPTAVDMSTGLVEQRDTPQTPHELQEGPVQGLNGTRSSPKPRRRAKQA